MTESTAVRYAGFWVRVFASVLDSIMQLLLLLPIGLLGFDVMSLLSTGATFSLKSQLVNVVLAIVIILFWKYFSATPGKLLLGIKIVDADTLQSVPTSRLVLRFAGYFVTMLPGLLMFLVLGMMQAGDPRVLSMGQQLKDLYLESIAALLCVVGFFWVGIDKRKQGIHDKVARTVVIYTEKALAKR